MKFTETETHTARKRHRCCWCWEFIVPGETYKRYRFYCEGDVGTVKMHQECYQAMEGEAKEECGVIEWTPGQERPTKEA